MPRPIIKQGPVTAKAGLADSIISAVKARGGRAWQIDDDGYHAGWVIEDPVTHIKAPAEDNYYILRVLVVTPKGDLPFNYTEHEPKEFEFRREAKLDELFDRFVEWLDKEMPPRGSGLWARIRSFWRKKA